MYLCSGGGGGGGGGSIMLWAFFLRVQLYQNRISLSYLFQRMPLLTLFVFTVEFLENNNLNTILFSEKNSLIGIYLQLALLHIWGIIPSS